jgi:hypothetical protein
MARCMPHEAKKMYRVVIENPHGLIFTYGPYTHKGVATTQRNRELSYWKPVFGDMATGRVQVSEVEWKDVD